MSSSTQRFDLLHTRLERFTRLLHGVEEGEIHAIHRTRVASRRLREVLPVLELDAEVSDKLIRRLRKVTEQLGPVRELDVLLSIIEELRLSKRYPSAALMRVAGAVRQARDEARSRRQAKLPDRELRRIAAKLGKIADDLKPAPVSTTVRRARPELRGAQWATDARIARRAAALVDAVSDAGAVYLPDRLHQVRIATKKLRYAVEVSVELAGRSSSPELKQLRLTQDTLGRLHDFVVLVDWVRRVQASLAPRDIAAWRYLDRLLKSLEDECRRLHGRYMRARPQLAAVAARLAGRSRATARRATAALKLA